MRTTNLILVGILLLLGLFYYEQHVRTFCLFGQCAAVITK
jgi:hypothetical protein